VISRLRVGLPVVQCRLSAWMDDRLMAGKPSRYVTDHLDHLDQLGIIMNSILKSLTESKKHCYLCETCFCQPDYRPTSSFP